LQLDTLSERFTDVWLPLEVALNSSESDWLLKPASLLSYWDRDMKPDSAAAAIFEAFSRHWVRTVLAARHVPPELRDLLSRHIFGVAFELLKGDPGWFPHGDMKRQIIATMRQALDDLTNQLGPDIEQWRWGDIHTLTLRHPLGKRQPLTAIFDTGPRPIGGAGYTLNNQWLSAAGSYEAISGANCRVAADLGTDELHITNCLGQSGHPGSPHYRDQMDDWLAGRLHVLSLDWSRVEAEARYRLELMGN
jgi:penicillin amidase